MFLQLKFLLFNQWIIQNLEVFLLIVKLSFPEQEGVKVVKSSKETCSVSNKRPSKNSNKPRLYGRFVKVKRSSFIATAS